MERLDYIEKYPVVMGYSPVWNEYNMENRKREYLRLQAVLSLLLMLEEPEVHDELDLEISAIDMEHYLDEDSRLESRALEIMLRKVH